MAKKRTFNTRQEWLAFIAKVLKAGDPVVLVDVPTHGLKQVILELSQMNVPVSVVTLKSQGEYSAFRENSHDFWTASPEEYENYKLEIRGDNPRGQAQEL